LGDPKEKSLSFFQYLAKSNTMIQKK